MSRFLFLAFMLALLTLSAPGCSNDPAGPIEGSALELSLTAEESPFPVQADLWSSYPTCEGARLQPCDPRGTNSSWLVSLDDRLRNRIESSARYDYSVKPFPARFIYQTEILVLHSEDDAMLAYRNLSRPSAPLYDPKIFSSGEVIKASSRIGDESQVAGKKLSDPACRGASECDSYPVTLTARYANVVFVVKTSGSAKQEQLEQVALLILTKIRRSEKP